MHSSWPIKVNASSYPWVCYEHAVFVISGVELLVDSFALGIVAEVLGGDDLLGRGQLVEVAANLKR